MKTVIIVRLYFDHFHILCDYTQKWINGEIKMMMMMMMMASSSDHDDVSIFVTDDKIHSLRLYYTVAIVTLNFSAVCILGFWLFQFNTCV